MDAIVCSDLSGRITVWNQQAEKLFGWRENEVLGKRMTDTIIPASHHESHNKGFANFLKTGTGSRLNKLMEVTAMNCKGSEFPIELFIVPIQEEEESFLCAFIRDISERKKSEAEILQTQMRFRQAQQIAHLGNWEINFENSSSRWSDEAYHIYGVEPGDHNFSVGDWLSFVHPDDLTHVRQMIEKGKMSLKGASFYHRIVRPDGEIRFIYSESRYEFDQDGKPIGLYGIAHDVTERKRLEMELREQNRKEHIKMTVAAIQAQEKERNAIGAELHDNVNQILVSTKLILSLLKDNPDMAANLLETSIHNIQNAINENRKISHELVAPDFGQKNLVEQVSCLAETMLKPADVDIDIDSSGFCESALSDQHKLAIYRIAQEQCTNIVKYAGARSVKILLSTDDQMLRMVISDDGKGMDPDKQTDGIGLRNIKSRLSVFNGCASVCTAPGKGFTLDISTPLRA
jgi:PAS domain S-box-containing protein